MFQKISADLIKQAAKLISESQQGAAFTGAGISTESGIPDFRSADSGLWTNIEVDPLEVASLHGFKRNPAAFYNWFRPLIHTTMKAQPNPAHYALADLEKMGFLKSVITQNIDLLHSKAGNRCVYELHGHTRLATCIHCFKEYDAKPVIDGFFKNNQVPKCCDCGYPLKPNVILFGEQLPIRVLQDAQQVARSCDLMIVIGSSLEVAPAGDLPILAQKMGAKIIVVNMEETPVDKHAEVVIHARAGEVLPEIIHQLEKLI